MKKLPRLSSSDVATVKMAASEITARAGDRRRQSARQAIDQLMPEIRYMRETLAWTWGDIAGWLADQGIDISVGTLRNYARESNNDETRRSLTNLHEFGGRGESADGSGREIHADATQSVLYDIRQAAARASARDTLVDGQSPTIFVLVSNSNTLESSIVALLLAEMELEYRQRHQVLLLNPSPHSSVFDTTFPDLARAVDLSDLAGTARLALTEDGSFKTSIIVDEVAKDENILRCHFRETLLPISKAAGYQIVVVRPVTPSYATELGLASFHAEFAEEIREGRIRILLARIEARGRTAKDYQRWDDSEIRKTILSCGTAEMVLDELGADYTEEMLGAGLSITSIAGGNFDRAPLSYRDVVSCVFDEDVRFHFKMWYKRNKRRMVEALDALRQHYVVGPPINEA